MSGWRAPAPSGVAVRALIEIERVAHGEQPRDVLLGRGVHLGRGVRLGRGFRGSGVCGFCTNDAIVHAAALAHDDDADTKNCSEERDSTTRMLYNSTPRRSAGETWQTSRLHNPELPRRLGCHFGNIKTSTKVLLPHVTAELPPAFQTMRRRLVRRRVPSYLAQMQLK